MRIADVASFLIRDIDITNRRLTWDMAVGMSSLAIAAAIGAVTMMVSEASRDVTEEAVDRTQSVASVIEFRRSDAERFTPRDYERLTTSLRAMSDGEGTVSSWTPIVTVIGRDQLTLSDEGETHEETTNAVFWSVRPDAAFLNPAHGMRYLCGGPFLQTTQETTPQRPCGSGMQSSEDRPESADRQWPPRLGVIVNAKYVRKFKDLRNLHVKEVSARLQAGTVDMDEIYLSAVFGTERIETLGLRVTGVIDEDQYPDLLFTEDLARAYFFRNEELRDCDLLQFRQWEDGKPLRILSRGDGPSGNDDEGCESPLIEQLFDYSFPAGHTPYGTIVATVTHWKTRQARQRIRDTLKTPVRVAEVENPHQLLRDLEDAADPKARRKTGGGLGAAKHAVLTALLKEVRTRYPDIRLSEIADVSRPKTDDVLTYTINDQVTGWNLDVQFPKGPEGTAIVEVMPNWTARIKADRVVDSMLNVRGTLNLYSIAMLILVSVLAGVTALLLAISHVLRKRRDIGVLLSNGASRRTILTIYFGEVLIMTVVGSATGLACAGIIAPIAEGWIYPVIERMAASGKDALRLDKTQWDLELSPAITAIVATLVILPGFLAIAPVWKTACTAPLASLERGI